MGKVEDYWDKLYFERHIEAFDVNTDKRVHLCKCGHEGICKRRTSCSWLYDNDYYPKPVQAERKES